MQISIILLGKLINFFIMILLGFILVNKNILKSSDSRILSIIVVYLVMPCAIIGSFEIDFTKEKFDLMDIIRNHPNSFAGTVIFRCHCSYYTCSAVDFYKYRKEIFALDPS